MYTIITKALTNDLINETYNFHFFYNNRSEVSTQLTNHEFLF